MSNPTASAIERVMECPASHVLPQIHESSSHAERGTEIHRFVRDVIAGTSFTEAIKPVSRDHRITCEGIPFEKLIGDLKDVRAEEAWAIDAGADAARFLGLNIGRKYPELARTEFAGTNDWAGTRLDGMPVVNDLKTGQPVTATRDNVQQKFHARAKMLAVGSEVVEARIWYVRTDGSVFVDDHEFTALELDTFGDELSELPARIDEARRVYLAGEPIRVSSGDWCKYCPAMPVCPKYTALARTMAGDISDIKGKLLALTPEQQGVAWVKTVEIENLVDEVKTALKAMAAQSPILLPDGRKEVRATKSSHTSFDSKAAIELLRTKGATNEEIAALTRSTPTAPIKAVNREGIGKPSRKKLSA